jgi:beta-N-acetylhexosaminidase
VVGVDGRAAGVAEPDVAELDADAVLGTLMLAFEGPELSSVAAARLRDAPSAGITVFRYANVRSAQQTRALTDAVQAAAAAGGRAADDRPLLTAADQEGGQLLGLGDELTPFAGNMALGAADDVALTERVAEAIGREMRAVGVNLSYSPCCDLASNPDAPALGIRSFGDDPEQVSRHAAAFVRGLHNAGVAACAKHFPGKGDIGVDSHYTLGRVRGDRERLESFELVPFRGAMAAGVDLVMSGHVEVPGLSRPADPSGVPATLSETILGDVLRDELGFDGLAITDALDMKAIPQGDAEVSTVVRAVKAGQDLLLCAPGEDDRFRMERELRAAAAAGEFDDIRLRESLARQDALRRWLGSFPAPDLSVVGSDEHHVLADELARHSITLVRNSAGVLPLRLAADARIAAIMPRPRDLTPADTSKTVVPLLADALSRYHASLTSFVTGHPPTDVEISSLVDAAADFDLLVVGTISAALDPGQAALVRALRAAGKPLVWVALRTPWDLAVDPDAQTYVCTYGIHRPSLDALADVLFGVSPALGRLPVSIEGLYERGHGLTGAITA